MQSEKRIHVAIIMDGNGRWATQQGCSRVVGHRAGVSSARRTIEAAPSLGIRCLTLYAFSSDNWNRPSAEVQSIFWLMRAFFRLEKERLLSNGVRVEVIGRRDRLPSALLRAIERAETATTHGSRLHLRIAIDYSSRDAISRAAAHAFPLIHSNNLEKSESIRKLLSDKLCSDAQEVDLLIRTGGEKRLSDFLLWESAYAELFFSDCMWPDFSGRNLEEAVHAFYRRDRRFGGLPEAKLQTLAG